MVIPHTHSIDSLNLSLAAGIGIYEFSKQEKRKRVAQNRTDKDTGSDYGYGPVKINPDKYI